MDSEVGDSSGHPPPPTLFSFAVVTCQTSLVVIHVVPHQDWNTFKKCSDPCGFSGIRLLRYAAQV